jgi:RHS repeat-associated protein
MRACGGREPYGLIHALRSADRYQPLGLPGQEQHEEDGERRYSVFRWYRTGWGRYTTVDPLVIKRANRVPHPYSYADANPLIKTDPFGLFTLSGPFPPGRDVDVMHAVADIVRRTQNSQCCASDEFRQRIMNQLNDPDLVIEYDPSLQHCGQTPFVPFMFGLRPRIVIGPAAWGGGCCYGGVVAYALAATIFHELGHIDGGLHPQIQREGQNCYGCQPPP